MEEFHPISVPTPDGVEPYCYSPLGKREDPIHLGSLSAVHYPEGSLTLVAVDIHWTTTVTPPLRPCLIGDGVHDVTL